LDELRLLKPTHHLIFRQLIERYTRKADQVRLARQAMDIQQADDGFATSAKIVNISERK